jgi:RNA polymerase sigma-70 factor (ECF subfamily)
MPETDEEREIDDAALLEAWRKGDRTAGAVLFDRHYASIARFFHNKVNEAAQEDLIHDTFLACLASAAAFRGESRFRTFLFGIAHNILAGHLRQLGRRMARLGSETDVDVDLAADTNAGELMAMSLGPSPVATVVQHQEQRILLEALRRIPLMHQIALELYYWEDLTAAEVGAVLGVPLGTAKTRLRDGRAYLAERLLELTRSTEALQSTLDDLERWAGRMRDKVGPDPADPDPSKPGSENGAPQGSGPP